MTIREKLQRLRAIRQLSQHQLASQLDIGVSTVQAFEAGRDVHLDHARRIAGHFHVSLDWLLDDRRGWPPAEGMASARAVELDRRIPADLTADEVIKIFAAGWAHWLEKRDQKAPGGGEGGHAPNEVGREGPARAVQ